jgi:hypothetical protein
VYVMGPAPELTQMVPRDGVILFIAFSDVQSCATAGWLSGERVLGLCGCCLPGIAVHLALESLEVGNGFGKTADAWGWSNAGHNKPPTTPHTFRFVGDLPDVENWLGHWKSNGAAKDQSKSSAGDAKA